MNWQARPQRCGSDEREMPQSVHIRRCAGSASGAAAASGSRSIAILARGGLSLALLLKLALVALDLAQLPPAEQQRTAEHQHAFDEQQRPVRAVHGGVHLAVRCD